jgi:hypothetical protein
LLIAQAAEQRPGTLPETIRNNGESDDLSREFPLRYPGPLSRFSLELIDGGEEKRAKSRTPQEVYLLIRVGVSKIDQSIE